jgi:hypothetical protein
VVETKGKGETHVESTHDRFELDVDNAVFVAFVDLDLLHRAKLHIVNTGHAKNAVSTHLGTKHLSHILTDPTIITLSILIPVNFVDTSPSDNDTRLLTIFARFVFCIP